MSDVELVIKIPEEMIEAIKFKKENGKLTPSEIAILNGTPLPKGHGRLIDADALLERHLGADYDCRITRNGIEFAPTIIEADKKYEAKVITRGNCMICGKELTEGLFLCKKCEDKASSRK